METSNDPSEGNKIYGEEDGRSWLDPHHISEKAESREASVLAGSLHMCASLHSYIHIHTRTTCGNAPQPLP